MYVHTAENLWIIQNIMVAKDYSQASLTVLNYYGPVTAEGEKDTALFRWHRWPYFYFAGQCSWIHIQKINYQLTDIFRLYLPGICITRNMVIKMCGN